MPMSKPSDAVSNSIIDRAPPNWRPFLQLSRFDRPIGFWLLGLPCFMGQALGRIGEGFSLYDLYLLPLWIIGSIAMRGAGCTINDIADKDFDAKVERTKNRPLACGAISTKQAYYWLLAQLLIGLFVLLALPQPAQIIALLAIPLVVLYPFMKRITWWPQVWLGITFNWGILVGFAAVDSLGFGAILLWVATIFWTLGYDTIYALSDVDDDALIGVKSTARKFGDKAIIWIEKFFHAALIFGATATLYEADLKMAFLSGLPAFVVFALLLNGQIRALNGGETDYTMLFRRHKTIGIWLLIAIICVALANWQIDQNSIGH